MAPGRVTIGLDEFERQINEAITTRLGLRNWEVHDLKLLLRLAKLRGEVQGADLLYLEFAGIPWSGKVKRLSTRFENITGKQANLF